MGPSNRRLCYLGTLWHEWGCCSLDSTILDSLLDSEVSTVNDEDSTLLLEEVPMRMCELSSEHSCYAFPKTDKKIMRACEESVPKTTRTDTALEYGMTGLRIKINIPRKWFHHLI